MERETEVPKWGEPEQIVPDFDPKFRGGDKKTICMSLQHIVKSSLT